MSESWFRLFKNNFVSICSFMFHLLECGCREREREGGGDVYGLNRLILCCLSCAAKLVPLAYGIKKLQICCVVEDDKVRKPLPVCVLSVIAPCVCACSCVCVLLCVRALSVCVLVCVLLCVLLCVLVCVLVCV